MLVQFFVRSRHDRFVMAERICYGGFVMADLLWRICYGGCVTRVLFAVVARLDECLRRI